MRLLNRTIRYTMHLFFIHSLLIMSSNGQEIKISKKRFHQPVQVALREPIAFGSILSNAIVVTEKKILFYDQRGNLFAEREYLHPIGVTFSKQGRYLGVIERIRLPEKGRLGEFELQILDCNNNLLWKKKGDWEYEGPRGPKTLFISDKDGRLITFEDAWTFNIYDNKGNLVKKVKLFEGKPNWLLGIRGEFSDDGEYFVTASQERPASPGREKPLVKIPLRGPLKGQKIVSPPYLPRNGNPWVFLFDCQGNELWRRPLPESETETVGISPHGRYVLVGGYTRKYSNVVSMRVFLFDKEGQKKGEYDLSFHSYSFSGDEKYLVLCNEEKIKFIKPITGKILWEKRMKKRIISPSVSNNGRLLIISGIHTPGEEDFKNPEIIVFDRYGRELLKKKFPDERVKFKYGKFDQGQISSDGRSIISIFKGVIFKLRIEE